MDRLIREKTMNQDKYAEKAQFYMKTLCNVKPNRRMGSSGNRDATGFFSNTIRQYGNEIDDTPFDCLDHICGGASLTHDGETHEVYASPYTLGCDVFAELITVSTIEELESTDCEGKILLMKGAICSEQLMPKNFVFYNPAHHQKLIALLENRKPAGIITATEKKPDQVGALYPFPLIVDGDFNIPSVYCRDTIGDILTARQGDALRLKIDANRLPSSATNIIFRLNARSGKKDRYHCTHRRYGELSWRLNNASAVVVLLLCPRCGPNYRGELDSKSPRSWGPR